MFLVSLGYTLKQLFTSEVVEVVNIYLAALLHLHFGE